MQRAQLSIEKRRHPRVTVKVPVKFKLMNGAGEREKILSEAGLDLGQTSNLSTGGVALLTHTSLKRHDLVKLEMELPSHTMIRTFAEVLWIKPLEGGEIEAGLQFLAVRNQDEDLISVFVLNLLKGGI